MNQGWWNLEYRISTGEWLEVPGQKKRWYPEGYKIPTDFESVVFEPYNPWADLDALDRILEETNDSTRAHREVPETRGGLGG